MSQRKGNRDGHSREIGRFLTGEGEKGPRERQQETEDLSDEVDVLRGGMEPGQYRKSCRDKEVAGGKNGL